MATSFLSGHEVEPETMIWRCVPRGRLEEILQKQVLHFPSARQFHDVWEGAIAGGNASSCLGGVGLARAAFEELCRLTKVTCWQMAPQTTPAMWARYARGDETFAIQSRVGRLMGSLSEFRLRPDYGVENFYAGAVQYLDLREGKMRSTSMLDRFFYKDRSLSYETEFRVAVSLRSAEEFGVNVPERGVDVAVDLEELICSIHAAPIVSERAIAEVAAQVASLGLHCGVTKDRHRPVFV